MRSTCFALQNTLSEYVSFRIGLVDPGVKSHISFDRMCGSRSVGIGASPAELWPNSTPPKRSNHDHQNLAEMQNDRSNIGHRRGTAQGNADKQVRRRANTRRRPICRPILLCVPACAERLRRPIFRPIFMCDRRRRSSCSTPGRSPRTRGPSSGFLRAAFQALATHSCGTLVGCSLRTRSQMLLSRGGVMERADPVWAVSHEPRAPVRPAPGSTPPATPPATTRRRATSLRALCGAPRARVAARGGRTMRGRFTRPRRSCWRHRRSSRQRLGK